MSFVHLHVHTQYSILDGLSDCKKLFARARELNMPAIAITDHGNMFGVKDFLKQASDKKNTDASGNPIVRPIIGCEVYVTQHYDHTLKDPDHRKYYHLILLAKNYAGYLNLIKIVSEGHINGMYYKPRVSHEILEKYHDNLICCSACLAGELPKDILAGDIDAAREAIKWHKSVFGDDYYLEVQLHKTEIPGLNQDVYNAQREVNPVLFRLGEEMGVKVVATNDVHFIRKEDGPVHDRLICLTTNANVSDADRLHYTQQEYLKSEEEMAALFPDHPEALSNTLEVLSKIETYSIDRDPVLPKFEIDPQFLADNMDEAREKYSHIIDCGRYEVHKDKKTGEQTKVFRGEEFCQSVAYLCHLTYKGAQKRYGDTLTEEQEERIRFELQTISKMGFPDYFLIVQDYIAASRKMGYLVGPGRGSAAGSVVAYCLGITNLDPIKYKLLFERFLNPDRVNMPDIDVDFEDLTVAHNYVEQRYGSNHVCRVITFGTMAAKSAIKDVARISQVSIDESNRLSKMVPDRLSEKQEKKYPFNPELDELKPGFKIIEEEGKTFQKGLEDTQIGNITLEKCFSLVPDFKEELLNGSELNKEVLDYAKRLEGSIRQVGQHACATIIGRGNLTDYIPICLSKDKETGLDVWTSQFDGHFIEEVGMLKMDFLGLNTLGIIHETLDNIKKRHGIDIDIEATPIDDKETFELYGRGDTTVVFQFESEGMKKWLQKLHPDCFEDLIAMNALYRPGPMDYIPDFVDRKQGVKPIEYDLPEMAKYLDETYGITVYQEQVMLLSQLLANFSKGEADRLRKAMGKKKIEEMMKLKDRFIEQGQANGHPIKTLDKIWKDWEKFAQYAFNKSHATCYAWVSYQTGWLKCHYTAEFLAANLSRSLSDMEEIKKIMADCRLHGIQVLNPDVNESSATFTVNAEGNIRFGLGGMKGFGNNVVDAIIKEREENGAFTDVFDFVERISINRKSLEILVYAGAFDSFGYKRSQFFSPVTATGNLFIDDLARYSELYKNDLMDSSASLFGDAEETRPVRPQMGEPVQDEDKMLLLQREKEVVGMYLSAHPLDIYRFEIDTFTNCRLADLPMEIARATETQVGRKVYLAGIVTSVKTTTTRTGSPSIRAVLEDYSGTYELALFGKDVDAYRAFIEEKQELFIEGELKARYFGKGENAPAKPDFNFRISKILSLGNVNASYLNGITISLPTTLIDKTFRNAFVKLLKKHKGHNSLTVRLIDQKHGTIDTAPRKLGVCVNGDLTDELKKMGLGYSVTSNLGR